MIPPIKAGKWRGYGWVHTLEDMVTVSTIIRLAVETVLAAFSSWMVVVRCFTVKPNPDLSLVTEPSEYTMRACSVLFE